MDIIISLILLVVVLTPLCIVVRDLWPIRRARRSGAGVPTTPPTPPTATTYPSLSLLEDMEDTMPACLRRSEWERPDAWAIDPRHPAESGGSMTVLHRH